jgi:SAM-dependent methyltransferase
MDPKQLVSDGYDVVAERYLDWSGRRPSAPRLRYLDRALELISLGTDVLDLGCGSGVPVAQALAEGRNVVGIDISAAQIDLARASVPGATFRVADMTTLDYPPRSYDAVVAFYSLTHVPRDEQPPLLTRIRDWLRPGGVFIASMGVDDDAGTVEHDWLGVDMYFSHFGARRNLRMVEGAHMTVESSEILAEPEDRHDARFLWIVARRP